MVTSQVVRVTPVVAFQSAPAIPRAGSALRVGGPTRFLTTDDEQQLRPQEHVLQPLKHLRGARVSKFRLIVTSRVFVLCWWMVFFAHVADMVFLLGNARLYDWLLHGGANPAYLLHSVRIEMSIAALSVMNWGFVVLAALHALVLLRMMTRSLREQELVFTRSRKKQRRLSSLVMAMKSIALFGSMSTLSSSTDEPHGGQILHRFCCLWWHKLVHLYKSTNAKLVRPLFAISGRYFDRSFLVEECVEVLCQVYQAYRSSVFISTRWINNLMVAMIFINCISTPVIHWLIPLSQTPRRRLISVTVSSFLNSINCVVIPLVIFLPYARAYDPKTHFFPHDLVWNDVWWVKAVSENEQVLVTSYLDFVTTLVPHWSIFNCLRITESLVFRKIPDDPSFYTSPVEAFQHPRAVFVGGAPVASSIASATTTSTATGSGMKKWRTISQLSLRKTLRMETLLYGFLVLSGFVVLGIHIVSQSTQQLAGCRLHATPWFSTSSSCTVLNVNCYRRGIEGTHDEIHTILTELSTETLFTLILTHCPRLQMPESLRSLRHLQVLEIYNCTLDAWPQSASIREQELAPLNSLTISRSHFGSGLESALPSASIPPGLMDEDMANMEMEIIVYETNLTALPAQLATSWANVWSFWCVACQLVEFPQQLEAIQMFLTDNPQLEFDPSFDLFWHQEMYLLDLSRTNVAFLPNDTSGSLDGLMEAGFENTQLAQVPKYLRDWFTTSVTEVVEVAHSLHGSPYCARQFSEQDEESTYQRRVCNQGAALTRSRYPIDIIQAQRLP